MKKKYGKPELNYVSFASSGAICSCDLNDPDVIYSLFDGLTITNDSFALTEACADGIDYDGYCKFTSADTGFKIFTS